MSQTDYQTLLPEIEAITEAQLKLPNMPIDVAVQEAINLKEWAETDQEKLIAVGLPETIFASLVQRAGALSYAQAVWMRERYTQEEAKKLWDAQSPSAYELRDDLIADMDYAFDEYPELLPKVAAIKDGSGHEDMIQDLVELAVLGNAHPAKLEAVGIDLTKLETANTTVTQMRDMLAQANGTAGDKNEEKVIRDKAYTLLKQAVDKVRKAGRYALRKDKDRLKGYRNTYKSKWY